jgi:hypothetical protein
MSWPDIVGVAAKAAIEANKLVALANATGAFYAQRSDSAPLKPIPSSYYNNTTSDYIGRQFYNNYTGAYAAADMIRTNFSAPAFNIQLPDVTSFDAGNAGGHPLTLSDGMGQTVKNVGTATTNLISLDPSSTINSLAAPIIAASNTNLGIERTRMERLYKVANGFFNSAVNLKVAELSTRYQIALNEKLSELTTSFHNLYKSTGMQALSILASWRNTPLEDQIARYKAATDINLAVIASKRDAFAALVHHTAAGSTFAISESDRAFYNSTQAKTWVTNTDRWFMEYLQLASNVPANGQSGQPSFMASVGEAATATSGLLKVASAATAITTGIPLPL